jgi:hypothetical protein
MWADAGRPAWKLGRAATPEIATRSPRHLALAGKARRLSKPPAAPLPGGGPPPAPEGSGWPGVESNGSRPHEKPAATETSRRNPTLVSIRRSTPCLAMSCLAAHSLPEPVYRRTGSGAPAASRSQAPGGSKSRRSEAGLEHGVVPGGVGPEAQQEQQEGGHERREQQEPTSPGALPCVQNEVQARDRPQQEAHDRPAKLFPAQGENDEEYPCGEAQSPRRTSSRW